MKFKKLLLSLFVSFVGLISFGYCDNTIGYYGSLVTFRAGNTEFPVNGNNCFSLFGYSCYQNFNAYDKDGNLVILSGVVLSDGHTFAYQDDILCFNGTGKLYQFYDGGCRWQLHNIPFPEVCPTCNPQYTSEECQAEYGLVSSGVLNSCQSSLTGCQSDLLNCQNSLSGYDILLNNCSTNLNSCNSSLSSCLQLNCPVSSGGVSWSSLFINDIQHIGAPTINISIPSEIQWDYLNENDEFNLTVDGYNTDTDYIEGIINIQNSKPSKEDFNNIVSGLIPLFVPGFVIILFIYFVFKLIKKIF